MLVAVHRGNNTELEKTWSDWKQFRRHVKCIFCNRRNTLESRGKSGHQRYVKCKPEKTGCGGHMNLHKAMEEFWKEQRAFRSSNQRSFPTPRQFQRNFDGNSLQESRSPLSPTSSSLYSRGVSNIPQATPTPETTESSPEAVIGDCGGNPSPLSQYERPTNPRTWPNHLIWIPQYRSLVNRIVNVKSDGNCGYRCIAHHIYKSESKWKTVLEDLISELTNHQVIRKSVVYGIKY